MNQTDEIIQTLTGFQEANSMRICIRIINRHYFSDESLKAFSLFSLHTSDFCEGIKKRKSLSCKNDCASLYPECSPDREYFIHTCHAHATEVNFPLYDNGQLQGLIQIGQFTCAAENPDFPYLKPDAMEHLICMGRMLVSYIRQQGIWFFRTKTQEPQNRKRRILDYIDRNIQVDPQLSDLAQYLDLSGSRTSHLIQTLFQRSFRDLKEERRLGIAQYHLCNNSAKIQWIASVCGIQDSNYFSRYFKEKCGLSPSVYRRKFQKSTDA